MGSVLFLLSLLMLFIRGDIALMITARRGEAAVMKSVSDGGRMMARKLFLLAKLLGGLRTDFRRFTGALPPVFMIVSNHQSIADIPALAICFPHHGLRYVAKRELGRGIPYISQNLRVGGSALISRTGKFDQGQKELREAGGTVQGRDLSRRLPRGHAIEERKDPGVLHRGGAGDPGAVPDAGSVGGRGRRLFDRHDRAGSPAHAGSNLQGQAAHPLPCPPREAGDHEPAGKGEIGDFRPGDAVAQRSR